MSSGKIGNLGSVKDDIGIQLLDGILTITSLDGQSVNLKDAFNNNSAFHTVVIKVDEAIAMLSIENSFNNCQNLRRVTIKHIVRVDPETRLSRVSESFNNCTSLTDVEVVYLSEIANSFNCGNIKNLYINKTPGDYSYHDKDSFNNKGFSLETINGVVNEIEYLKLESRNAGLQFVDLPASTILHVIDNYMQSVYLDRSFYGYPGYMYLALESNIECSFTSSLDIIDNRVKMIYFSKSLWRNAMIHIITEDAMYYLDSILFLFEEGVETAQLEESGIHNYKVVSGIDEALAIFREDYKKEKEKYLSYCNLSSKLGVLGVNPELREVLFIENAQKILKMQEIASVWSKPDNDIVEYNGIKVPRYIINFQKLIVWIGDNPVITKQEEEKLLSRQGMFRSHTAFNRDGNFHLEGIINANNTHPSAVTFCFGVNKITYATPYGLDLFFTSSINAYVTNYIGTILFSKGDLFPLSLQQTNSGLIIQGAKIPLYLREQIVTDIINRLLVVGCIVRKLSHNIRRVDIMFYNLITGQVIIAETPSFGSMIAEFWETGLKEDGCDLSISVMNSNPILKTLEFRYSKTLVKVIETYKSLEDFITSKARIGKKLEQAAQYMLENGEVRRHGNF